jgi:hypothetical protein
MRIDLRGYQAGPIGRAAATLFDFAATDPLPATDPKLPSEAATLLGLLRAGAAGAITTEAADQDQGAPTTATHSMIACTGGKDSLAAALKEQAAGRAISLFYIAGINPAYPGEKDRAIDIATALGCALHILKVKPAKQPHIENPAKNATILGLMVDYGMGYGIARYALGTQYRDHARRLTYSAGFSDGIEVMDAAAGLYKAMARGAIEVDTRVLRSEAESYAVIAPHGLGLWDLIGSCMTPARYKGNLHTGNVNKFGAETIRPGRCGSCYKCAQEIIYGQRLGILPPDTDAITHAERVLHNNAEKVFGGTAWTRQRAIEAFIEPEESR